MSITWELRLLAEGKSKEQIHSLYERHLSDVRIINGNMGVNSETKY